MNHSFNQSLYSSDREESRPLTAEECRALGERVLRMCHGGEVLVNIDSTMVGGLRWGRNHISSTVDTINHVITVTQYANGRSLIGQTNKLDNASIKSCIETAQRISTVQRTRVTSGESSLVGPQQYLDAHIYSDATIALDASARATAVKPFAQLAEQQQLLAAGYLGVTAQSSGIVQSNGWTAYTTQTLAAYSISVRDRLGTASGWAGSSLFDWAKIDIEKLSHTAIDKCIQSANPRMIEPGRYTTILEPQAVAELMQPMLKSMDWGRAAKGYGPWRAEVPGRTKVGKKMFDPRITIQSDPADPEIGYPPFDSNGFALNKVVWVETGILKTLQHDIDFSRRYLGNNERAIFTGSFRADGGPTSIDEMIAQTERGVLVTRFNGAGESFQVLDYWSLTLASNTRDGTWLIERGKITHSIRNLGFVESPVFVFNKVDLIGPAVPVHRDDVAYQRIVPAMRIRDFNFTHLTDAV